MGNEITITSPFGSNVSLRGGTAAMAARLAGAAEHGALGQAPDGSVYMNFSGKRGVYEFGPEKEDVQPDEVWLINVEAFEEGYVCWKGGNSIAKRLASVYGTPVQAPESDELGPFNTKNGEGWFNAKSLVCRSVDEDNRQGYFTINSKTGVAAMAGLQKEVAQRMGDEQPCWPLVQFDREKFQAQGNWNHKPVFRVYGWLGTEQVMELGSNPEADLDALIEEAKTGKPASPKAAAPAPEPAPVAAEPDPAPATRQRRTRGL